MDADLRGKRLLCAAMAAALLAGCLEKDDGGGGDGDGEPPRIGRGAEEPVGETVTVSFQNGAGGYAGGEDYKIGSVAPANLLEIERLSDGSIIKKTYLRFELTGSGIPAGAEVVSASMTLTVYRENGCWGAPNDVLEVRRLTEAWTGAGGKSYVLPPSPADGSLVVESLPNGSGGDPNVLDAPAPLEVRLDAALVQLWLDAPSSNDGVAVVPAPANDGMQLHFFSSAEGAVQYRPELTVTYTLDTNLAPAAAVSAVPTSGAAPLAVSFTGSGTDPDGTIAAYRYDFDDGAVAFTASAGHTFERPGTYFVNFSVGDDGGKTDTDIVVVTVADPSTPAEYPSVGFHPPGGEPPASGESVAPTMSRPLPSSRRDVLVWHDQVIFNPTTEVPQAVFAGRKMVGSQKMPQNRIEVVRPYNPDFRVLQYHLAYGLTRGDDWVDKNVFGPEKAEFDAWMAARGYGNPELDALIINSPLSNYMSEDDAPDWGDIFDRALRYAANFYYVDIGYDPGGGALWQRYIVDETVRRMQMNDAGCNFDGTFFDTASNPTSNLTNCPSNWYTNSDVVSVPTNAEFAAWWGARAESYFNAVRSAYSSGQRYLVLPNSNRMLTNWFEPSYLQHTDGAFVESFACGSATTTLVDTGAGEWERSLGRTLQYITGPKKVMLAVPTADASALGLRMFCAATFLLVKNDTSYYSINASGLGPPPNGNPANPRWFPEYEIGIGAHLDPCPEALDDLRAAGSGGGGLYVRWYGGGLVLVNTSPATAFDFELDRSYYPVSFSGGGWVATDGSKPAQTLTTGGAVSGTYSVPPNTGRILRAAPLP